ncbi:hypothetical protein KC19_11G082700 [Ceratodon purpureus]|uniref:Uncharacterized protein n=1 Tax=Ceratodon purpureus TaxID=3225 RepID=A0A8T0GBS4_CERPU|nr:hypothetical protein KC19_11G082700 [Ceratodon purpureus]
MASWHNQHPLSSWVEMSTRFLRPTFASLSTVVVKGPRIACSGWQRPSQGRNRRVHDLRTVFPEKQRAMAFTWSDTSVQMISKVESLRLVPTTANTSSTMLPKITIAKSVNVGELTIAWKTNKIASWDPNLKDMLIWVSGRSIRIVVNFPEMESLVLH